MANLASNILGGLRSYGTGCIFNSTPTVSDKQEMAGLASYVPPIGKPYNAFSGAGSSYSPCSSPSTSINPPPYHDVNRMSEYAMSISSRPAFRGSDGRYK